MTTTEFREWLRRANAPMAVREWAERLTPQEAWRTCGNSEWLLWWLYAARCSKNSELRLLGCWAVRQVWHLLHDPRSRNAVEVAERYAAGEATDEELTAAGNAARDVWDTRGNAARLAAQCTTMMDAWSAAWDTCQEAVSAARKAAWDAIIAADATDALFAGTAANAAGDAARRAQADKLRELIPWSAVEELLRAQLAGEAQ